MLLQENDFVIKNKGITISKQNQKKKKKKKKT